VDQKAFTETEYATWKTAAQFNVGYAELAATVSQIQTARKIATVQACLNMLREFNH